MKYLLFSLLFVSQLVTANAAEPFRGGLSQKKAEAIYADPATGSGFFYYGLTKIHYRVRGHGKPVMFVHGTMDSLHTWNDLSAQLEPYMQVISFDLPGFGLSDGITFSANAIEDFHPVMDALASHLGLTDFAVAGHSLGGIVAWTYALDRSYVNKLILVGTAGYKQKLPPLVYLGRRTMGKIVNWLPNILIEKPLMLSFYLDMRWDILGDHKAVSDLKGKTSRMVKLFLSDGNVESYFAILEQFRKYQFQHAVRIHEIQQPVLFLVGDKDDTIEVDKTLPLWRQDLPNGRFVTYSGVGHYPHWERTADVAAEIREFVGSDFLPVER